jgi:uncharacterized membrane protein YoaK (UPF0700 family)
MSSGGAGRKSLVTYTHICEEAVTASNELSEPLSGESRMPLAAASSKPLPAERRAADSLACALLLAFTGGVLDAFLYLDHGRVFAGAMTGNAVLCAVGLLHHDAQDAVMHLLPLVAFGLGAWVAFVAESHLRHAVIAALSIEAACLLGASFLPPSFPDVLFVPLIAGLAGFQVGSFRTVDKFVYSSTFITGELREGLDALHRALEPGTRRRALREFRDLGLVILFFLGGGVSGAVVAVRIGNHTLWIPAGLLLVVLGLVLRRERRRG